MDNLSSLIYFIFSCVSQGFTIILIILHIWILKLRRHPGQFVLIQCLCQLIYDVHWLSAFHNITGFQIPEDMCQGFGMVENFFTNLGLMYTLALSLEIYIKFRDISNIAYYKRSIFYHMASFLVSGVIMAMIYLFGTFGESPLGTCGLKDFTSITIQNSLRVFSLLLLIYVLSGLLRKTEKIYSTIIYNYCLVIISVWFTWALPGLLSFAWIYLDCFYCYHAAVILGTLSGTLVGISRLSDKRIYKELKKKGRSKNPIKISPINKRFLKQTLSSFGSFDERFVGHESVREPWSSINCFSDLFRSLINKVTPTQSKLEILSTLFVFFAKFADDVQSKCDEKTKGFVVDHYEFDLLSDVLKEAELNYLKSSKIVILEFRSEIFKGIRKNLGYESLDIANSLAEQLKDSYSQARAIHNETNNSMVLFTKDLKFVIKTITKEERMVFLDFLLDSYNKRILKCKQSKLIRILGVFKILPSEISFILMENSNASCGPCLIFDLKGSSIDRFVQTSGDIRSTVLKDMNLAQIGKKIKLTPFEAGRIMKNLKKDLKVLRNIGIMDYSLLLIVSKVASAKNRYTIGQNYSIAIIDIFQIYDTKKALERCFKSCFNRRNRDKISSVSPDEYYQRLLEFLNTLFTDQEDRELSSLLE